MDIESRREKEGLRCGHEGLLRGGRWVGDPIKGAHAITSGQTQPRNLCIHFNRDIDERRVGWVGEAVSLGNS